MFWVFGEVVLDVAEVEGAEDRLFGFTLEEKFERGFDEAFDGGLATVFGPFEGTNTDFISGFVPTLLDRHTIFCVARGLYVDLRFHLDNLAHFGIPRIGKSPIEVESMTF